MKKLRVCIISCGMIARSAHIPAYQRFPDDYEIVAVCDINYKLAEETAARFSIPHAYADAETMLKAEKPDVVSVCAGNRLHKPLTALALQYGAHVLCEKPLAIHTADALELFALAKEKGVTLTACQTMRYMPERLAARRLFDSGTLGDIYHCEVSRVRRRGIPYWGTFHIKAQSGGGALLDIGIHALDAALWMCGNPTPQAVRATFHTVHEKEIAAAKQAGVLTGEKVQRVFRPEDMDVESFSSGYVTFENGMGMLFKSAWAANLREENNIILSGTRLGVDCEKHEVYDGGEPRALEMQENDFGDHPFFGHFYLMRNFSRYLRGEEELTVKPAETVAVTAVMEAAYLSAEQNREVQISELYDPASVI